MLAGCASVQPYTPPPLSTKHQIDRSYLLGREQYASVGDPIIKVKDYYIKKSPSNVVRADRAFSLRAPPVAQFNVPEGATANIIGITVSDGITYRVVLLPQFQVLLFLLREDGTFEGSAINRGGSRMGWTYTPNPPDVHLVPDATEVVETSRGYTNFELIYGGATGDTIQILYREYTQNDLARPAFSQQLIYSRASKRFRFKDMQVDVSEANNERIVYTVISDGMASAVEPK